MDNGKTILSFPDGHLHLGLGKLFKIMGFPFPDGEKIYVTDFQYPGNRISVSVGLSRPVGIVHALEGFDIKNHELPPDKVPILGVAGVDNYYNELELELNGNPLGSLVKQLEHRGFKHLLDLGYRPSSLVLAVHKNLYEEGIHTFEDFKRRYSDNYPNDKEEIYVASEFEHISDDFLGKYNIRYNLMVTAGKTETPLKQESVDAIIDVAETGNRILTNDGYILQDLFVLDRSTPQLVTTIKSYEKHGDFIEGFKDKMEEAVERYKQKEPGVFTSKLEIGLKKQSELYDQPDSYSHPRLDEILYQPKPGITFTLAQTPQYGST